MNWEINFAPTNIATLFFILSLLFWLFCLACIQKWMFFEPRMSIYHQQYQCRRHRHCYHYCHCCWHIQLYESEQSNGMICMRGVSVRVYRILQNNIFWTLNSEILFVYALWFFSLFVLVFRRFVGYCCCFFLLLLLFHQIRKVFFYFPSIGLFDFIQCQYLCIFIWSVYACVCFCCQAISFHFICFHYMRVYTAQAVLYSETMKYTTAIKKWCGAKWKRRRRGRNRV